MAVGDIFQRLLLLIFLHLYKCKKDSKKSYEEENLCTIFTCNLLKEMFQHMVSCQDGKKCTETYCLATKLKIAGCKSCKPKKKCFQCTDLSQTVFHQQRCPNANSDHIFRSKIPKLQECQIFDCIGARKLLCHLAFCSEKTCSEKLCSVSKKCLIHWLHCVKSSCRICMPLKSSQRKTLKVSRKTKALVLKRCTGDMIRHNFSKPVLLEHLYFDKFQDEMIFRFEVYGILTIKDSVYVPKFTFCGLPWQIFLEPTTNENTKETYLGIFLQSCLPENLSAWFRDLHFEFRLKSPHSESRDYMQKFHHRFCGLETVKGSSEFIQSSNHVLCPYLNYDEARYVKRQCCENFKNEKILIEVWLTTSTFAEYRFLDITVQNKNESALGRVLHVLGLK